MIDGAPQVAELAVDLHKHLIPMPAAPRVSAYSSSVSYNFKPDIT
jgi:hypothetical protein